MFSRHGIALAVLSPSLLPLGAHAGAGGSPTAPAAGKATEYCCQVWRADTRRHGDDQGKNSLTSFTGSGCIAIFEDDVARNSCGGTVVKCRGEFFTPSTATDSGAGKVERCLTP
jgi:hypothetical protein